MDFNLSDETRALKALVADLVRDYGMPLERKRLRGEVITREDRQRATNAAKDAGLWGLNLPKEYGGIELSTIENVVVTEENSRCLAPIQFGGNAGPLLAGTEDQKQRYMWPLLTGEKRFAFAQTEPSGGSDPGGRMTTTAVRKDDRWIINGQKVFISGAGDADFILTVAVTDRDRRQHGGISMFIVDRDAPGLRLGRRLSMLDANLPTWEVFFDDCEVPEENLLGAEGTGFATAQKLLSSARMNIGAQAVGIADRCLQMMTEYAKGRVLFGEPIAHKQAIQGMIVDSWVEVHQMRLAVHHAAWKNDQGNDTRVEAGLVKYLGSEMVGRVVDRAIQVHGALGASRDLPLAHWYDQVRMMRLYEGPTEVQKYRVVARALLGD
jgi:acyl-CoA dehydrogenase